MRGGAILGGRGRVRDRFVGETTRYVVEKAPCKVILTAPPAGEEGTREGVALDDRTDTRREDAGAPPRLAAPRTLV